MYAADRFEKVHEFIAFCESKPANEAYDWEDESRCACGQFFNNRTFWLADERAIEARSGIGLDSIAGGWRFRSTTRHDKWTFGALAKRVRKALEKAGG